MLTSLLHQSMLTQPAADMWQSNYYAVDNETAGPSHAHMPGCHFEQPRTMQEIHGHGYTHTLQPDILLSGRQVHIGARVDLRVLQQHTAMHD